MFIEMAADSFQDFPKWLRESQQQELTSFGDVRAQKLGATLQHALRANKAQVFHCERAATPVL
jgi:hypothetical protein